MKQAIAGHLVFDFLSAARLTLLSFAAKALMEETPVLILRLLGAAALCTSRAQAATCLLVRESRHCINMSVIADLA